MPINETDGFKYFESKEEKLLAIDSTRIDACMEYFKAGDFAGIWINSAVGYKDDNVDFLARYPETRRVEIVARLQSISGLMALRKLQHLQISDFDRPIDFSAFPNLEVLRCEWAKTHHNVGSCRDLRVLHIRKYAPESMNLQELSTLCELRELELVQSKLASLKGIDQMGRLQDLQLSYMPRLEDIDDLASLENTLKVAFFDHCRKIRNHAVLGKLACLKTLVFVDCGKLPSIGFIRSIPTLKNFRILRTDIADGDMSPCIGIKHVDFDNKKHFSHTVDGIRRLTENRGT